MLTKDLIRFNNRKGHVYPRFLEPDKTALLDLAETLIDLFNQSADDPRAEIEQAVAEQIEATNVPQVVAKGFEKLLFDRCKFQIPDEATIVAWRQQVLNQARQQLQKDGSQSLQTYQQTIAAQFEMNTTDLQRHLYGDLAENHTLASFKTLTPQRLIHKYNAAQVMWLLLWAREVTLTLPDVKPEGLRQLTKYLRFRRLLAEIEPLEKKTNGIRLKISGPLDIFHKTQRYGLNLALFFPAVLHQTKWKLEAAIELSARKKYQLELDHTCKIKPDPEHFSAYIPDDFQKFQDAFQQKVADWTLQANTTFLALTGDSYCFPDYVFLHRDGAKVAMELFHPWHAHQIEARLQQLAEEREALLLIGVDRKLAKKPEIAEVLAASAYFQQWGILFNDLPPSKTTERLLNQWHKHLPA